jgi:hypothetical protein
MSTQITLTQRRPNIPSINDNTTENPKRGAIPLNPGATILKFIAQHLALWTTFACATLTCCSCTSTAGLSDFVGEYQLAPDRVLTIWRRWGDQPLMYHDSQTEAVRGLFAKGKDRFVIGKTIIDEENVAAKIAFDRNEAGHVTSLSWQNTNAYKTRAPKTPYPRQAIRYPSGDVTLAGVLTLPLTEGPHPAIVLVHGSGPQPRDWMPLTHVFARNGFAVLEYDKRGIGESTGKFEMDFSNLADDVVAGVQYLKARPEIDPSHIGLWGISQAGWIIPLAASRCPDVSFAAITSGPVISPSEEDVAENQTILRDNNFPPEEIEAAAEMIRLAHRAGFTNQGWSDLDPLLKRGREKGWLKLIDDPVGPLARSSILARCTRWIWAPSESMVANWYYDTYPALEAIDIPILWIFGKLDKSIPPMATLRDLQAFAPKHHKNYTFKVFEKGNHTIFEANTGYPEEVGQLNRFCPGYLKTLTTWTKQQVAPRAQ